MSDSPSLDAQLLAALEQRTPPRPRTAEVEREAAIAVLCDALETACELAKGCRTAMRDSR